MDKPTDAEMSKIKRIGADVLGVICILAGVLFGWVPGPGGIPLILAGLGLLSINHEWARRWLQKMKDSGSRLNEVLFPDNRFIKLLYDILAMVLIGLAAYLLSSMQGLFVRTASFVLVLFSFVLFFLNRRRGERLRARFLQKH
jgi:hypothetical protein